MRKLILVAILGAATMAHAEDKKTERVWKSKCASCHGVDGKGDTDQGKKLKLKDMSSADWQKNTTDAKMRDAILNGVKGEAGEMEAYKDKLASEQVDGLVNFIHTLKK